MEILSIKMMQINNVLFNYQVAKDGNQEHNLRDKLKDDVCMCLLDQMIPEAQSESKDHVEQSKDEGDFHFVSVQEGNLVLGCLPNGINA